MKLSGNTILITSGGSGTAPAEKFVKLDNELIVTGHSPEKLEAAAQKEFKTETMDMSDAAGVQAMAERVFQDYPSV